MMDKKPVILVTNDDGVSAKGIRSLVSSLNGIADVVVVAPDGARSGQSSAITPSQPLRLIKISQQQDLSIYKSNGTPVDCVKLACHELFNGKPDLIVSGINHGSNAAISIIYSGTMGAVLEGCIRGVPSIGFSLCDFDADADFSHTQNYIRSIVQDVLERGLQPGICLNVNFPAGSQIKGVKVCRQANGYWTKEYEKRIDPVGRDYYWLTGYFHNLEPDANDTDEWALKQGFVSVVPCQVDMTAHSLINEFTYLEKQSK